MKIFSLNVIVYFKILFIFAINYLCVGKQENNKPAKVLSF